MDSLEHFKLSTDDIVIDGTEMKYSVGYTPSLFESTIKAAAKILELKTPKVYDSEYKMELSFQQENSFAGVVLNTETNYNIEKLDVVLRFPSQFRNYDKDPYMHWVVRCNGLFINESKKNPMESQVDLYLQEGFLQLQHQILLAWLHLEDPQFEIPNMTVRSIRYQSDDDQCNYAGGSHMIYIMYYMCFLYPFLNVVQRYARERYVNIVQHHKKYGYHKRDHWIAHFLISMLHFFVLDLIVLLMLKVNWIGDNHEYHNTFEEAGAIWLLLFLLLYNVALIMFAMSLSCAIRNPRNAVLAGLTIWITCFAVFSITLDVDRGMQTTWGVLAMVVFFNNAIDIGLSHLQRGQEVEVLWKNFFVFWSLLINIMLQFCILWHLQYFLPGQYLRPATYNPLRIASCMQKTNKKWQKKKTVTLTERMPSWHNFEFGPVNSQMLVKLKQVCTGHNKAYRRRHHLQNVSMRIFRGEITVLLGHNGAGKTSLLIVIAGGNQPLIGRVVVKDRNMYSEWNKARRHFDFCMSMNTLFYLLTATENLRHYIIVKRGNRDEAQLKLELEKWMEYLKEVIKDPNIYVRDMTFEQQRLLFLCCTLCCNTPVVLLDEPTQHMRWREQRLYWKILQQEKPDRAIVVATNCIDEADTIADRIAMMNNGLLHAYGTPFFLKTKYGTGWDLIILKSPSSPVEPITEIIAKYFPNIMPDNQIGDQVFYKLPYNKSPIFQRMLIQLENESNALGIRNLRMLGCELGEIYMRLGMRKNNQSIQESVTYMKMQYLKDGGLVRQQIRAMFFKKIIELSPVSISLFVLAMTVLVTVIIGIMSKQLIPLHRNNTMQLGFASSEKSPRMLDTFLDCDIVEITKVYPLVGMKSKQERIIKYDSLNCINNITYEEYIQNQTVISNKYGAVEKNKSGEYTAWFNERIFHTAPMALNLMHNLMLLQSYVDCTKPTTTTTTTEPTTTTTEPTTTTTEPTTTTTIPPSSSPDENDRRKRADPDGNFSSTSSTSSTSTTTTTTLAPRVCVERITTIINHPFHVPLDIKMSLTDHMLANLVLALTLGLMMPLAVSSFIIPLAEEKRNGLRVLHQMAGLSLTIFWITTLLWDMLTMMAYIIIFQIAICFVTMGTMTMYSIIATYLVLSVYSFPALLLTYIVCMFSFKSVQRTFLIAFLIHISTGLFSFIIYLDIFNSSNIYYFMAMHFPDFAMLDGISNLYREGLEERFCEKRCSNTNGCTYHNICDMVPSCCTDVLFSTNTPGMILALLYLIIMGIIFLILLFSIDLWRRENRFSAPKNLTKLRTACYSYDDRDVVNVKKRIAEAELRELRKTCFVVDQLENKIEKGRLDLHTVSFDVDKNMCLVIYGPRHSGKTHLIKQMIGRHRFCFGDIYVKGVEFKYDTVAAYRNMSYCPQKGGLYLNFSAREVLHIFAMIRGIPENKISEILVELSNTLDMRDFFSRKLKYVSAERRRKVNIALALLMGNDIILLDEPTTGMGGLTRREIWNVLRFARFCNKTLIITSVDSIECDAMADQCIIFEDGEMLAIGSGQYLRKKFTRGFYLEVKLKRDGSSASEVEENLLKDIENLHRFATFLHEESELRTHIDGWVKFYCPVRNVIYSYLFGALEKNKRRLNIAQYTISQGNMDDVMRNIAVTRLHKQKRYN